MELQYYGANCVRITTKQGTVVIDDNLKSLGLSSVAKPGDIVLFTNDHLKSAVKDPKIVIDMPGEFEVAAISVQGVPARAHMDEEKTNNATIFKVVANDIRVVALGHMYPELTDDELEAIGTTDILLVPVGGNGYTLDAIGALKLIKKIEPKIVIPTHYGDSKIKYEVPQADLEEAIKNMSMEVGETTPKLKLKSADLPEVMRLIVLERQ